jgi:hypothetical protein
MGRTRLDGSWMDGGTFLLAHRAGSWLMKMGTLAFDLGSTPTIQLVGGVGEIIIDPRLSLSARDKNKSSIIFVL